MRTRCFGALAWLVVMMFAAVAQSQPDPEIHPMPKSLEVGGKSYEIVFRETTPDGFRRMPPKALQFQDRNPIEVLDKTIRYWLGGASFVRSPDGRFALPFHGEAPFVGYIDLEKKSWVAFKDAFPPTGEQAGMSTPPRYRWVALVDEGPRPQGLWLLVSRWNRELLQSASWRVRVPFDAPDRIQVATLKDAAVIEVFARSGKEFLALVSGDSTWARISTETWKVLAQGKPSDRNTRVDYAAYSPDKSAIYALDPAGLVIFNAQDGRELARPGVGKFANAFTLGATFDPSGSVAVVASPYAREIALMDVKTLRILHRYQAATPLAGIVFDAKESKAYAIKTSLPYE